MVVYIVKFDWSTTDAADVELFVYSTYEKAYNKFKDLVQAEYNPDNSWVGNVDFDDNGEPIGHYEFWCDDNDSGDSEVYWHIEDQWDYNMHSFIDLLIMEVH